MTHTTFIEKKNIYFGHFFQFYIDDSEIINTIYIGICNMMRWASLYTVSNIFNPKTLDDIKLFASSSLSFIQYLYKVENMYERRRDENKDKKKENFFPCFLHDVIDCIKYWA